MRTGIIVLAALGAAVAVDAAWLWSAPATVPGLALAPFVPGRLAALALAGLAAYALAALVLVAARAGVDATRVRHRLARLAAPNQRDWTAAFEGTVLNPLAVRILDLAPLDTDWARTGIVVQSRFDIAHARREIGQLYSGLLVRAQFVTAVALCLMLAALGWTQGYAPPAAAPAIAAVVVLALLGVLGRLVVDAAAEPLFETIANLPVERLDIELLRRLVWLSEEGDAARTGGSESALSSAIGKLLARLIDALDEGRIAVVETMTGLSAQAETLALAMRSVPERGSERGETGDPASDLAELHSAVRQLRAIMDGLAAASGQSPLAGAAEAAASAGRLAEIGTTRSDLGQEVRRLLADLE